MFRVCHEGRGKLRYAKYYTQKYSPNAKYSFKIQLKVEAVYYTWHPKLLLLVFFYLKVLKPPWALSYPEFQTATVGIHVHGVMGCMWKFLQCMCLSVYNNLLLVESVFLAVLCLFLKKILSPFTCRCRPWFFTFLWKTC